MTNSLRDQLIKAGLRPGPKAKPKAKRGGKGRRPAAGTAGRRRAGSGSGEISLAKAYRIRQQDEQHREAERKKAKQREDELRRRQNKQLEELLEGRTLNDPEAEIPRHFRDGDRITRLYVTDQQRTGLAQDRLGIVKLRRRYLLVDRTTLEEAVRIKPDCAIDLAGEVDSE